MQTLALNVYYFPKADSCSAPRMGFRRVIPVTKFFFKRLGQSLLVLLGGAFLLYILVINSGDPLQDLRESNVTTAKFLCKLESTIWV